MVPQAYYYYYILDLYCDEYQDEPMIVYKIVGPVDDHRIIETKL